MGTFYVSDLDGTLLDSEGKLSDFSRQTLGALLKEGLPFTVASARSVVSMRQVLGDFPLTLPIIEFNGAFISDLPTGRHQVVNRIEPGISGNLLKIIADYRLLPFISAFDGERDRLYYNKILNEGMAVYLKDRQDHGDPRLQSVEYWEKAVSQDIVCMTVIGRLAELEPLEKAVLTEFASRVETHCFEDIYARGWYWLTLHDRSATKDQAIQVLRERYGLMDKELVVFGDEVNDIKMFKLADRSIAVENAVPALKRHAHLVIGPNHQDSVARFIEEDWRNSFK